MVLGLKVAAALRSVRRGRAVDEVTRTLTLHAARASHESYGKGSVTAAQQKSKNQALERDIAPELLRRQQAKIPACYRFLQWLWLGAHATAAPAPQVLSAKDYLGNPRTTAWLSATNIGTPNFPFSLVILSWGELWLIRPELPLIYPLARVMI